MLAPTHRLCRLVVPLITALCLSATAYAGSAFRQIGYDSATQGTANADAAYGESAGVLYTNPALMSRFPDSAFIGVSYWKPDMTISLMPKPAGTDIPLTIYNSKMGTLGAEKDLAQPTKFLRNQRGNTHSNDNYAYVTFGTTMSMGIKGFRFGNLMSIPIDSMHIANLHTYHSTEYEQYFSNRVHFTNFGEWNKMIDGLMGASYSPPFAPWMSLGVSLRIGMSTVAQADLYMPDPTKQDYSLMNNNTSMELALKPIIGVQFEPLKWMSIGLTWRYRSYMNINGGGVAESYHLTETSSEYTVLRRANQKQKFALDYEPQEVTGALGFKTHGFTTNLSATWNMWKYYLDSHHQAPQIAALWPYSPYNFAPNSPSSFDPYVTQAADGSLSLSKSAKKKINKFKWKDTVTLAWGGQYDYIERPGLKTQIRAGYSWIQSPVPAQVGRTNYADNDTMGFTLGHRVDFTLMKQKFGVDFAIQYWRMLKRTVYKDPAQIPDEFYDGSTTKSKDLPMSEAKGLQTNNPGFPGYTLSGYTVATSVTLRYEF